MRTWHDNNVQSNAPCRQVLTVQLNYLASLAKVFVYELRVVGLYPIAVTLTLSYAANKWKCFTHENNHEKKLLSNKIPLKKYLLTHEIHMRKSHEIPTRKNLGRIKYIQQKSIGPTKYPWRQDCTMVIELTRFTLTPAALNLVHSFK